MKREGLWRGEDAAPPALARFRTKLLTILSLLLCGRGQGASSDAASVRYSECLEAQSVKQGFAHIGRTPGYVPGV